MKEELLEISKMTSDSLDRQSISDVRFKIVKEVKDIIENNIDINNIDESIKDKNNRLVFDHISWLALDKLSKVLVFSEELEEDLKESLSSRLMSEEDNLDYNRNFSFMHYIIEEKR